MFDLLKRAGLLLFGCAPRQLFVASLDVGGVVDSIFGGGDDAPSTDPAIGAAAQQNAEVARETLAFNRQVYEEGKPRQAANDAVATQLITDQLAVSQQNQAQAADQWNRFRTIFAPVEEQVVRDATEIDSNANLRKAAGEAAAGVQAQAANAQAQSRRSMAAMGINPNSGRALALEKENQLGLAASKAAAANNARTIAKDKGISLRAGAANFGRNMPNTAANSYGIAVQSGNSAMNNSVANINAANSSASMMNQGYNTAIGGNASSANILQNQLNGQQQYDASGSAGLGALAGQLGSAAIMKWSSKKLKEGKTKIDHGDVLKRLKDTPVEAWRYKKGVDDEGEHVGPYAEDMQKQFGDKAAPGGKMVDLISMIGIGLSATKGLADQVDKLEKKLSKVSMNPATRGVKGVAA